jgi:hypothetical protein
MAIPAAVGIEGTTRTISALVTNSKSGFESGTPSMRNVQTSVMVAA